jgi:hypothetical protein
MRFHLVRQLLSYLLITFWWVAGPLGVVSASDKKPAPEKNAAPYALIFGTVWDAQGRPKYGIPVKIRRADQNKAKWELMSDHRGEFAQRVPSGKADYIVWTDIKPKKRAGGAGAKRVETTAHIENDERIDVGLHLTE